ncbi:hypothetical protein GH733_008111 [Mirounga leonina]|nr:hypothetical protein GH733_008111 [Mirounga leonina]
MEIPEMESAGFSALLAREQTVSLNQRRIQWDTTERDLVERVRNLRQRLTVQARNRRQPPHLLATQRA